MLQWGVPFVVRGEVFDNGPPNGPAEPPHLLFTSLHPRLPRRLQLDGVEDWAQVRRSRRACLWRTVRAVS